MMRFRVKFIKDESVKFLSHLDILRTFARAIRRSGLPIAYSQGFNPHPVMSFGLPLSVGVTSEGELVDMDIEGQMTTKEIVDTLNRGLPSGLKVLDVVEIDAKSNVMAQIRSAKYKVTVEGEGLEDIDVKVNQLLSEENIIINKETKSGTKETDIKSDIKSISVSAKNKSSAELIMELSAGSVSNLKPEFVVEGLKKYCGITVEDIEIHRLELGL